MRSCLVLLAVLLPRALMAQPAATAEEIPPGQLPPGWRVSLYWDNDGWWIKPIDPNDRYYTNGFKLVGSWQPAFAQQAAQALPLADHFQKTEMRSAFGLQLAQEMYTAFDIEQANPPTPDHPYAAWLYTGAFLQRSDLTLFEQLEIQLGVIGPSALGDEIQSAIHTFSNSPDPLGWDTQLPDEPGVNLVYRRKWKLRLTDDNPKDADERHDPDAWLQVEALPQFEAVLGTVRRHVGVGGTLRAGRHLPGDFGPGRLNDLADATRLQSRDVVSAYGFVQVMGRAVEHDAFLEGGTFEGYGRDVSAHPLVGEVTAGVAVAWRGLSLSWSLSYLTEQFEGQGTPQSFGTWWLSFQQPF